MESESEQSTIYADSDSEFDQPETPEEAKKKRLQAAFKERRYTPPKLFIAAPRTLTVTVNLDEQIRDRYGCAPLNNREQFSQSFLSTDLFSDVLEMAAEHFQVPVQYLEFKEKEGICGHIREDMTLDASSSCLSSSLIVNLDYASRLLFLKWMKCEYKIRIPEARTIKDIEKVCEDRFQLSRHGLKVVKLFAKGVAALEDLCPIEEQELLKSRQIELSAMRQDNVRLLKRKDNSCHSHFHDSHYPHHRGWY